MTEEKSKQLELQAFTSIVSSLADLEEEAQRRILTSVQTFLKLGSPVGLAGFFDRSHNPRVASDRGTQNTEEPADISDDELSVKEFIMLKDPKTDIEKVACLAYYLEHYRHVKEFKTLELSKLNTEAAQHKFGNAAQTVKNTFNKGFLIQVGKGKKKLSAMGEEFVNALPDRELAKDITERMRRKPKRVTKRS